MSGNNSDLCNCGAERREKIGGILERMLELIEQWISEGADEGNATPGVGDVKQIMVIIKDMVAVMERLPAEENGPEDSMGRISVEELCNESERLLEIVRGSRFKAGQD